MLLESTILLGWRNQKSLDITTVCLYVETGAMEYRCLVELCRECAV